MSGATPAATGQKFGTKFAMGLLWFHVGLYVLIALIGYWSAEIIFGTSVFNQTSAFAARMLSAALVALAALWAACARDATPRMIRLGLLCALVFDVQVPVMMGRYPAILEHLDADLGMPWFLVPAGFVLLAGVTGFAMSRAWSARAA